MITPGQGLPDKPWRDVGDPTAQYVRVPCDALTDLERKRGQFQYRDRMYRVIAHDFLRDVYGAELISGGNVPAGTVNEQLVDTVRKQLRIHLAPDEYAERIALATAAAIEEHRGPVDLLASATVLRLQPGDVVTVKFPHRRVSAEEKHQAETTLKELFPNNDVLVLDQAELTITRPEGDRT